MGRRLPPGCGLDIGKPLLHNPYFQALQDARRLRKCFICKSITPAKSVGELACGVCWIGHQSNTSFPRVYKSLHLRAGRRSGKSLAGAHAVREEIAIPGQKWWVCGPTFKILHDATMPTLLRLIPVEWVEQWNQDNLELTLTNQSVIQFRSLDDPERGRGQGLHGVWIDEAAFCAERAWYVLSPSLAENAGIVITTTSPGGFDWTYKTFYKRALIDKIPGYWAAKYRTLDNPLFQQSAVLRREVEEARLTMPPDVFAAEYEGDDVNFTGVIYGQAIDTQVLDASRDESEDNAVRQHIPEWPHLDATRRILVGMDSGADHPFGATLMVVTPTGLVVVDEYLERRQAFVTHLAAIQTRFRLNRFAHILWAANKNEAQLRIEFALRGVMVAPAENKHAIGIQRVQSWLHARQMWFVASRVPKTIDQMRTYRYAENYQADGQKRDTEGVFKVDDELPDSLRYACQAFPELPSVEVAGLSEREQSRWNRLDEQSKLDIERIRAYNKQQLDKDLETSDPDYPVGSMYGNMAGGLWE